MSEPGSAPDQGRPPDVRSATSRRDAPVSRAVVLARGLGTRMRASSDTARLSEAQSRAASTGMKALVTVGADERPFLDHQLSELADAGLTDICLVIGPEHDAVRTHLAGLRAERVHVSIAVQAEPLGTADAVRAARDVVGDDRFVVVNSDNFYPAGALRTLAAEPGSALVGFDPADLVRHSNIPAERVAAFALLATRTSGELVDIVEKPDAAQRARFGDDAPVSMNCWLFTPAIFPAIEQIEPSARGEYELPDAVRAAIAAGERFHVVGLDDPRDAGVLDLSGRDDISAVAERLATHEVRL